jgi:hypothetical protein
LAAAAVEGILAYRRKRLVIRKDEIHSHGPLFVRTIRFADVIVAHWMPSILDERIRGLLLRTAKRRLEIYFDHFVQWDAQVELIVFFRRRLGPVILRRWETPPGVWRDREAFQALREGRASPWSPPVFTIKRMWRMLAVAMGLAMIAGAAIGFFLQIQIPDAAALWAGAGGWTWSGWLPLDWGLGSALLGLVIGLLFVSLFRFSEWTDLKWRTFQGRRLERSIAQPPPNAP